MIKFLTDRQEIAKAINIDRIPVITVKLYEPLQGFDYAYGGYKVLVVSPTKGYPDRKLRCTVHMYGDELNKGLHDTPQCYRTIHLSEGMVGIAASFGLNDIREMIEWNQAPLLQLGQEVIVFFDGRRTGWLRRMKVNKYGTKLIDVDEREDRENG